MGTLPLKYSEQGTMDWRSIMEQIDELDKTPRIVDLPVSGEMLEKRVRVSITAGLVDLPVAARSHSALRCYGEIDTNEWVIIADSLYIGEDGEDFVGGNYAYSLNFSSNLPKIFEDAQNLDLLFFADMADIWGVDYNSSIKGNGTRSSIGIALDWMSPAGPMNFTWALSLIHI